MQEDSEFSFISGSDSYFVSVQFAFNRGGRCRMGTYELRIFRLSDRECKEELI